MSAFSEKLKAAINKTKIPLSHLSAGSGLDITYISKMKSGERICSDTVKMKKLIDQLSLTPNEQYELLTLYKIAKVGEENYRRNGLVKEIIENVGGLSQDVIRQSYDHDLGVFHAFYGQTAVNHAVKAVIEKEASLPDGRLRMLAQHDYRFLYEVLPLICCCNSGLTIEHVFYLQTADVNGSTSYNLECFKAILPLLLTHEKYTAMYYYCDNPSSESHLELFPIAIITTQYVIHISADACSAIVTNNPDTRLMMNRLYDDKISKAICLCTRPSTNAEIMLHYANFGHACDVRALYSKPSLGEYISKDIAEKYVKDSIDKRDFVIESITQTAAAHKSVTTTTYFTADGIKEFLTDGRLIELPDSLYEPLEKKDRYDTIARMIKNIRSGRNTAYAIKTHSFKIPAGVFISTLDRTRLSIVYDKLDGGQVILGINESGIISAFTGFLAELCDDGDLVYTAEESAALLEVLLSLYGQ